MSRRTAKASPAGLALRGPTETQRLGSSTRLIACAICLLPLLMSVTTTLRVGHVLGVVPKEDATLGDVHLDVLPIRHVSVAPSDCAAVLALILTPGTTW